MNGTLVIAPALLLEPETATGIAGGREIFDRMVQNHWLKPHIKQRKLVRYAAVDLVAAVERLKLEDLQHRSPPKKSEEASSGRVTKPLAVANGRVTMPLLEALERE